MATLIVFYALAYYVIASFSLILRVFFQLYIYKAKVTKGDFTASIFWPALIWLIPLNFVKDIITYYDAAKNKESRSIQSDKPSN